MCLLAVGAAFRSAQRLVTGYLGLKNVSENPLQFGGRGGNRRRHDWRDRFVISYYIFIAILADKFYRNASCTAHDRGS